MIHPLMEELKISGPRFWDGILNSVKCALTTLDRSMIIQHLNKQQQN